MKEVQIKEYLYSQLVKTGYSHTEIKRTPLGEKVIIYTTRPGLVVGKKGENIQRLTNTLKKRFKMENPQIEIGEIKNPSMDCYYMADKIITTLERFGAKRFKSIGYSSLQEIMDAGATGAEVIIGGRGVPSSRAKSWMFSAGYLKKSGDIKENYIPEAKAVANLKTGAVGVKVRILTPDIVLPDKIYTQKQETKEEEKEETKKEIKVEEVKEEIIEEQKENKENGIDKKE
jgi:small subunit ribosomal protein S3